MARPRLLIGDTIRGEIYAELCNYATANNAIPSGHAFWANVMKPKGYTMKWSTFRWHWEQLRLDGLVSIDKVTGAVIVHSLKVTER